jgi:hypothetical protein
VKVPGVSLEEQPATQTWRLPHFASTILQGGPRFLPGRPARAVRGVGWVEEPWLRQGAAISYLKAGAAQHAWLLLILLSAALVYLVAAFTSLGLAEARDTAIRRAVGWTRRDVFAREMRRALVLGISGAIAGSGLGLGVTAVADLAAEPLVAAIAVPVGIVVSVVAAMLPAYRVTQLPLARILAGGEVALGGPRRRRSGRSATGIAELAVAQLLRLRALTLTPIVEGGVATGGKKPGAAPAKNGKNGKKGGKRPAAKR